MPHRDEIVVEIGAQLVVRMNQPVQAAGAGLEVPDPVLGAAFVHITREEHPLARGRLQQRLQISVGEGGHDAARFMLVIWNTAPTTQRPSNSHTLGVTAIFFGWASAFFGIVMVTTPLALVATTLSPSAPGGSVTAR